MFAHITPLEMPVVWVAFALGLVLGGALMALWMKRTEESRDGSPRNSRGSKG